MAATETAPAGRLALEGGPPGRTRPLPTGFFGRRRLSEEEKMEGLAALEGRALCRRLDIRCAVAAASGTAALD